jgi:hypothetical protein
VEAVPDDGHAIPALPQCLGATCDEINLSLSNHFDEAVFAGTLRTRLIGSDSFNETGHTRCAVYLWAALQTHIILQGYIELEFIAHPEVSSVVVEHLIQTRVSMPMHEALKAEMIGVKASAKASATSAEKLESKMARQPESIINFSNMSRWG